MTGEVFTVRYNVMKITSLHAFTSIKGGVNRGCKDVYFVMCIGAGSGFLRELASVDEALSKKGAGKSVYRRDTKLKRLADVEETVFYTEAFSAWEAGESKKAALKHVGADDELRAVLAESLQFIGGKFRESTPYASSSMVKNFIIKMLFWIDTAAEGFLENWSRASSYKYIYSGEIKKHEYLFLYLLTRLGVDVLLLASQGEPKLEMPLLELSERLVLGPETTVEIPGYVKKPDLVEPRKSEGQKGVKTPVNIRRPERDKKYIEDREVKNRNTRPQILPAALGEQEESIRAEQRGELAFEELALMASSVVMIEIQDKRGNTTGTGSGIMVAEGGYILSNHHVIGGGTRFLVRLEEEGEPYQTDEVIKYNHVLDLALIRIERKLRPIPIYKGEKKLVRGQKVVAIGSPLGLFNSVSDGIISGFRSIRDVEMIQFTAPISHGSSGGAVLNMQGELIGISTAGIDQGQNLNLAVDYRDIRRFLQGFI